MKKISKLVLSLTVILAVSFFGTNTYAEHDTFYDRYLENGEFVLYAPQPTTEEEFWIVSELFTLDDDHVQEIRARNNYIEVGNYFSLTNCNEGWTHCTFDYRVFNNNTSSFTETHSEDFDIHYVYDPAVKNIVNEFLNSITISANGYEAKDMELLNYWLALVNYSNSENTNSKEPMLPNFSSELKAAFANTNLDFEVDVRCGFRGTLTSGQCGIGKVYFNGSYYQSVADNIEVKADHVFYVPSNTADEDITTALEERIYSIFGESLRNKVQVITDEDIQTVADILSPNEINLYDFIDDANSEKVYFIYISDGENPGVSFPIVIKKDSNKLFVPSGITSTDLVTGINISTDINNLPGDTKTRVTVLGANIDKYTGALETDKTYTYNLGLRSDSTDYDVTKEEGHVFTVSAPIPENLKGLAISAYFIGENGEIEEYKADTSDGANAIFDVPHFSVYTLAESSDTIKAPNTGTPLKNIGSAIAGGLVVASGATTLIVGAVIFSHRKHQTE